MKKILLFSFILLNVFLLTNLKVEASSNSLPEEYSKVLTITGINTTRYTDYLVYYDSKGYKDGKAPTNGYGYEVAVNSDGYIEEASSNVNAISDGFILSGHGINKDELMKLQVGDKVVVDLNLKKATVTRTFQDSTFARSKITYDKITRLYTQLNSLYLEYNESLVDDLYQEAKGAYDEIKNLTSSELTSEVRNSLTTNEKIISTNYERICYLTSQSSSVDFRALWHRPKASKLNESTLEGLKEFLVRVKETGFNTIFLETYYNGYFTGKSQYVLTHPSVTGLDMGEYGDDYLKAFVTEAGKLGLEVHAWCHTFMAGGTSYISSQIKDEWLLETYTGSKLHENPYGGAYYLDPSNDEVIEYMKNLYIEILSNYDLKGLQLDYIRYWDNDFSTTPYRDSGYGELSENKFLKETGLTGSVREIVKTQTGRDKWNSWRCDNITEAVSELSKAIKSVNKDLIVSAAVVSNISQAKNTYMQEYTTWVKNGYIDLLCPMIYTGSVDQIGSSSREIISVLNNMSYLSSGIAPIYYGYSNMVSHSQVESGVINSIGTSYFASQNIYSSFAGLSEAEKSMIEGVYRKDAINPLTANVEDVIDAYNIEIKRIIDEASSRGYLEDPSILVGLLESVNSKESNNPKDYQEIIVQYQVFESYATLIKDEIAVKEIKSVIDKLINYLEVKINRYLINNGYWNPESGQRPKLDEIKYSDEVESNPEIDLTPEPSPTPDQPKESCTGWFIQIMLGLSLVFIVLLMIRKLQK